MMASERLPQEAIDYGRRVARSMMAERKGHGGAPIQSRNLTEAQIIALAALAFQAGMKSGR